MKIPYFLKKIFKNPYAKWYFEQNILPKNKTFIKNQEFKSDLKNILFINTLVGMGGACKIAYNMLCQNLQKRGYNARILVNKVYGIKQTADISILSRIHTKDQKILWKAQNSLGWLDFFQMESFNIKNMDIFKNADIVHLNNLHGNYFSLFALPELTALKPTIWTLHDQFAITGHCAFTYECDGWLNGCKQCPNLLSTPEISKDTANFLFKTKKKIYDNSDFTVVCYSEWMKSCLEKSILKDKDIKLIYNGIDTGVFKPYDKLEARKELNLPLDKKILLFSSNLGINNPQKGIKYLNETYNYFKNNENIMFIALGGDKKEYISERFLNLPYVHNETELAKYYSAADLFIFPTLAETFGLVIAESLACQTPVISFKTGPVPEIISHMETGYIANYKDINDFIKGIKLFLEDDLLRENASSSGRRVIEDKFSLNLMIDNYSRLYQEVFEARNSSNL